MSRKPHDICKAFRRVLPLLTVLLAQIGCSEKSTVQAGDWQGNTETTGDITTVRTISGSVWSGKARLVEEVSIGSEAGDEAYLLGRVESFAFGNDRIYVLDTQVPVIRMYDMEGRHLGDIGAQGDGPGEYRRPRAIAVHPLDGRLFVRDGRGHRINVYSPEGRYLERWPMVTSLSVGYPLCFLEDGTLLSATVLNPFNPIDEWQRGIIGYGPEGATGDTIPVPIYDFESWQVTSVEEGGGMNATTVPFSPDVTWTSGDNGIVASGVSTSYRFELRFPDGRTTVIEKDFEPVPVLPEEREWWEETVSAGMRVAQPGWRWNGPAIPRTKPPYNALLVDPTGRVWVRRPGPGVTMEGREPDPTKNPFSSYSYPYWVDTLFIDVFDFDGRYLGEIETLPGFYFHPLLAPRPWIRGDTVLALFEDEAGVPYVKLYRLEIPE